MERWNGTIQLPFKVTEHLAQFGSNFCVRTGINCTASGCVNATLRNLFAMNWILFSQQTLPELRDHG